MLDGFDEISPFYKETVVDLLQALRQTAVEQLWVTTRPHLREELEDTLQQMSYTLEPFSEKYQVEFLTKFWSLKDWFTEPKGKGKAMKKNQLKIYAEHLIKKLAQSISDKDKEFTGIPLQTRMLAEAFDKDVKIFCDSAESIPDLPSKLDVLELYGRFIERKYDIYQEEKFRVRGDNVVAMEQRERDLKSMRSDHQLLALKLLFNDEQVSLFQNNIESTFSTEHLTRFGIVQINCEGKLQFIHRTLSEYYVADCLLNHLNEWNNSSREIQTFILQYILQEEECRVIRVFIDAFLSTSKPSDEVQKYYGILIYDLSTQYVPILCKAAVERNVHIMGFLLDCLQATAEKIRFIDTVSCEAKSHIVADLMNFGIKFSFVECLEMEKNARRLSKEILFNQNHRGEIIWHVAARNGQLDVLQKTWDWAKQNLTRQELKENLLLATDRDKNTAWDLAAEMGQLDILQRIWEWAKENLTTEEISNKLLLATDQKGRTILHLAAEMGKLDIMQRIWDWAKKNLTTEEISNTLLLATDQKGRTALHLAAEMGKLDIMQRIWDWAKENLTTEEMTNKLLLATDQKGRTALHLAAEMGKLDIMQKIWEWAKENLTTMEISNKLLLATDNMSRTALHVAAEMRKLDIMQKIWEWAKENLTTVEISNKLLLATDNMSRTTLHVAAEVRKLDIMQKVWDWAKENLTTEEISNKLLLATDQKGRTALHVAAEIGKLDIM